MSDETRDDAPETPAHIFAFRAFKTTLFGTPAVKRDETITFKNKGTHEHLPARSVPTSTLNTSPPPLDIQVKGTTSSPIKSILLTPGNVAPFRKTVTFTGVRDDAAGGIVDPPREFQREESFDDLTEPKDALRKTLFKVEAGHYEHTKRADTKVSMESAIASEEKHFGDDVCKSKEAPVGTSDHTVDLKSPKSASGQHWKNEYHKEHDKTKIEMKRLIRYSQIAKSFAAKRDDEASRMREKLEEAEEKVQQLEAKAAELASRLAGAHMEDSAHSHIMKDLAVQTAAAIRHKQRAERYRAALQDEIRLRSENLGDSGEEAAISELCNEAQSHGSEKKDGENENLTMLQQENQALRQTIIRVKEEMKRYEERHRNWQESRRRRDERWAAKRKDLEKQLNQSREENARLQLELHAMKAFAPQMTNTRPSTINQDPNFDEPKQSERPVDKEPVNQNDILPHHEQIQLSKVGLSPEGDFNALTTTNTHDGQAPGKHPYSVNLPKSSNSEDMPSITPGNETLDLWSLAAGTHVHRPGPRSRVLPAEAMSAGGFSEKVTVNALPDTGEALWDNLRRRTSMSILSNLQSNPDERRTSEIVRRDGKIILAGVSQKSSRDQLVQTASGKENVRPI